MMDLSSLPVYGVPPLFRLCGVLGMPVGRQARQPRLDRQGRQGGQGRQGLHTGGQEDSQAHDSLVQQNSIGIYIRLCPK